MQKFAVVALHAQAAQPVAADDRAVLLRELLVGHAGWCGDGGSLYGLSSGFLGLMVPGDGHRRQDVGDERLEVKHELIKVIDRRWARAPALRRGGHGCAVCVLRRRRWLAHASAANVQACARRQRVRLCASASRQRSLARWSRAAAGSECWLWVSARGGGASAAVVPGG